MYYFGFCPFVIAIRNQIHNINVHVLIKGVFDFTKMASICQEKCEAKAHNRLFFQFFLIIRF